MSEALPFWSRGGIAIRHNSPLDGEYLLRIRLQKNRGGSIIGLGEPHQLDVRLDGARIKLFTIGGKSGTVGSQEDLKPEEVEAGLEVRFPAKAGTHLVGVAFLDESSVPEGMLKPPVVRLQLYDRGPTKGDPGVESVAIGGPYDSKGAGETPSRRKTFVCRPTESCARLTTVKRRKRFSKPPGGARAPIAPDCRWCVWWKRRRPAPRLISAPIEKI